MTNLKNYGVLLVDDDEVDIKRVKRSLEKIDAKRPLHIAHNGLEALSILKDESIPMSQRPKIILLDLNMPKMDGLEFLQTLRADPLLKHLPVIILTTSNNEQDKTKAYEANVAGYILKPLTEQNFLATLETFDIYWKINKLPS